MARLFDYVIVGGGSAGCVLAGRLSEDPDVRVCLLEAGPSDDSVLIRAPLGFAAGAPLGLNTARYSTVPQAGLGGRRGFQPRGRVLGGSSAINAMMHVRGHRSDYDHWAALGNPGWDFESVLPFFKRAENSECTGANALRGVGGPLNVCHLRNPSPLNDAFLAACESAGLARTADYNGAQQEGCWPVQVNQKDGERCSAAAAYLTPHLGRSNLTVLTDAKAAQIELAGGHAIGVHYQREHRAEHALARREVILSAGSYGSPRLLMLSGIGPGAQLQALGIPVRHDLPGVGQNLQDHITVPLIWRSPRADLSLGLSLRGGARILKGMLEWRRQRTGLVTSNVAESGAFFRSRPELSVPDIEATFVVGMVDDHNRKMHWGHGYTLHVSVLRPRSRGRVALAGTHPRASLRIDPGYLSHPDDMATLVAGTRQAMAVMNGPTMAPFRGAMLYPFDVHDANDIERVIRQTADTEYHPVGTCRMGPANDPSAVVDAALRVHGVAGLRVVDASVMPTLTGGNTNAPTVMIAEKAAEMIKRDRPQPFATEARKSLRQPPGSHPATALPH